jgi:hypothetical protein
VVWKRSAKRDFPVVVLEPVTKPSLKIRIGRVVWFAGGSVQSTVSSTWAISQRRTSGQSAGFTSTRLVALYSAK